MDFIGIKQFEGKRGINLRKLLEKYRSIPIELKASVAYTICNVLVNSVALITIPLFTRLLTTEQYGQFSIYQSWLSIMTIFLSLNLPYGSFNTAMVKFENDRDRYISSVEVICITLSALFMMIYLPFSSIWNRLFELPTYLMVLMCFEILAQASLQFWYGKERFKFQYKAVVIVTLLIAFLAPIISLIFVMYAQEKGFARIVGGSAVTITFGLIFLLYNMRKGSFSINKKYIKYALSFNIALIPYYLSQTIFNQSDRLMIKYFQGVDKAGIYSVAYSLATILVFVLNAINNSYVPWLYKKIKMKQAESNKYVSSMIAIIMAFLLFCVVGVAPEIIYIMAGTKYLGAIWVVPPVAMSLLFLFYAQLFINIEFNYEEKWLLVGSTVVAAIINIVLNGIFIPVFGYVAAAYTTLASYIIFTFSNYFAYKVVCKKQNLNDNLFDYKKLFLIAVVFCTFCFAAMGLYTHSMIRYTLGIIVVILLAISKNRILNKYKEIQQIFAGSDNE